jgi:cobalamin biosynthesis protein CbiG
VTENCPHIAAQQAAALLREALAQHDITLPDLGVDLSSIIAGYSAVRLGSASAATVRKIAALLNRPN